MPFFSVIIPLYNKENRILLTVKSVLSQSINDLELIVVNDGSTDGSLIQLSKITDNRLLVINKNNEGVSAARNTGIKSANGMYIAFLDADDLWDNNFLLKMKNLIIDFPLANFFSCQFSFNGHTIGSMHNKRGYIDDFFLMSTMAPLICSSTAIIKQDCFKEIGLFNPQYSRGEDIDMWIRLARKYKMAFEPACLSHYIQDSGNSASYQKTNIDKYFLIKDIKYLNYSEKKYALRFTYAIINEMLYNRNAKALIQIIIIYNFYSISLFFSLFKEKFFKSQS